VLDSRTASPFARGLFAALEQMTKTVLSDVEDSALAACDDMYLEASSAREILSSWYARRVSFRELRAIYRKLSELGFLRTYVKSRGRYTLVSLEGHRTATLSVRATSSGRKYLSRERNVL
jgi:hypothetical protein